MPKCKNVKKGMEYESQCTLQYNKHSPPPFPQLSIFFSFNFKIFFYPLPTSAAENYLVWVICLIPLEPLFVQILGECTSIYSKM